MRGPTARAGRGAGGVAAVVGLSLVLAACGREADGTAEGAQEQPTLTVLAAASLTDVLEEVAVNVEGDHPGLEVELSFAASSTIVQQVNQGAPADVVALAGLEALEPLEADLRATEPVVFATNTLELAVPPGNPAGISGLEDVTADGIRLVVCEPAVPCGAATAALFEQHGIDPRVASYEHDVRATLAKVQLGEADAGVVYRTDVAAAGDGVTGIEIPAEDNVVSSYPVLAVSDSELARAFVDELMSGRGQDHLRDVGFGAP